METRQVSEPLSSGLLPNNDTPAELPSGQKPFSVPLGREAALSSNSETADPDPVIPEDSVETAAVVQGEAMGVVVPLAVPYETPLGLEALPLPGAELPIPSTHEIVEATTAVTLQAFLESGTGIIPTEVFEANAGSGRSNDNISLPAPTDIVGEAPPQVATPGKQAAVGNPVSENLPDALTATTELEPEASSTPLSREVPTPLPATTGVAVPPEVSGENAASRSMNGPSETFADRPLTAVTTDVSTGGETLGEETGSGEEFQQDFSSGPGKEAIASPGSSDGLASVRSVSSGASTPSVDVLPGEVVPRSELTAGATESVARASGLTPTTESLATELRVTATALNHQLHQAITQSLRMRSVGDNWTIDLRVDPPDLGPIRVQLQMHEDGIRGVVQFTNPRIEESLQKALPELQEQLREEGKDAFLDLQKERDSSGSSSSSQKEHGGSGVGHEPGSMAPSTTQIISNHLVDLTA